MKNLKKSLGLLILVGILAFGYIQLDWFGGYGTTAKSDTSWLMVLHSGEAEITETGGRMFLTLSEISRNTVMFSDRPERKYQSVDTYEFLEQWDDLFASSPPNAAMVHAGAGVDTEIVVIELFSPVVSGDEISFLIEIVGGEYMKDEMYTDVNLFIDSFDWDEYYRKQDCYRNQCGG